MKHVKSLEGRTCTA